jgi:hypothetical protein
MKGSGKSKSSLEEDDRTITISTTIKSSLRNLPVMVTAVVHKKNDVH